MLKKIIENMIYGLGIGFIITTFFVYFDSHQVVSFKIMLTWLLASIIYGASSILFDYLELRIALISHLLVCLLTTLIAGNMVISTYQLDKNFSIFSSIIISFLVIYLIIYTTFFLLHKKEAKKLNKLLQEKNNIKK